MLSDAYVVVCFGACKDPGERVACQPECKLTKLDAIQSGDVRALFRRARSITLRYALVADQVLLLNALHYAVVTWMRNSVDHEFNANRSCITRNLGKIHVA